MLAECPFELCCSSVVGGCVCGSVMLSSAVWASFDQMRTYVAVVPTCDFARCFVTFVFLIVSITKWISSSCDVVVSPRYISPLSSLATRTCCLDGICGFWSLVWDVLSSPTLVQAVRNRGLCGELLTLAPVCCAHRAGFRLMRLRWYCQPPQSDGATKAASE